MNGEQKGEDFRIREGPTPSATAVDVEILLRDDTISGKHAASATPKASLTHRPRFHERHFF